MSDKSWLREFYPVTAAEIANSDATVTMLVEHAIQKWRGLLPENLERHSVELHRWPGTQARSVQWDGESFLDIDGESCSLCERFYVRLTTGCEDCPLAKHLGHPCDDDGDDRYLEDNLYTDSLSDPSLMVKVLSEVLAKMDGCLPIDSNLAVDTDQVRISRRHIG